MTQDPYAPSSYPSGAPASYPSATPYTPPAQQAYDPTAPSGYEPTMPLPTYAAQPPAQPAAPGYTPQTGGASGAGFQPSSTQPAVVEKKDGLGALFDFGFTRFATPSLVKIVYILVVVMSVLAWIGGTLMSFLSGAIFSSIDSYGGGSGAGGMIPGVLNLLFGWIPALLNILVWRLILEFFVVQFRTHSQLREIKEQVRARASA